MKIFILILVMSLDVYGHGNHHIPGVIPPAPHGGVLTEAQHMHIGSHDHDHGKASKKEIFYEAKLKKNKLKIFPLELDPKESKTFILRDISKFTKAKFKVVDARKKKIIPIKLKVVDDHWEGDFKGVRGRRFLVEVDALYHGARYKGKVQVEKK